MPHRVRVRFAKMVTGFQWIPRSILSRIRRSKELSGWFYWFIHVHFFLYVSLVGIAKFYLYQS